LETGIARCEDATNIHRKMNLIKIVQFRDHFRITDDVRG